MKKYLAMLLAMIMVLSLTTALAEADYLEGFDTNPDGFTIGFSNSFNGNTYRQREEEIFFQVADALKELGVIKEYIVTESNGDNATQATQIQSLILKGVDAIIVDPGSPTACNSAIEEAWDLGIPCFIVNGGPVTTEKCYQMNYDYEACTIPAAQFVADKLEGKGNVIISRGISGVPADTGFYAGMRKVFDEYPEIKIVAEVYSKWSGSVAQKEIASVLPSLDQVDAVIGEGGDGYGAVQAFKAANREVPLVIGGNRGNFISWWVNEYEANGYETMSWLTNPGIAGSAIFVAIDVLRGVEVPKNTTIEGYVTSQEDIIANAEAYKLLEADEIVAEAYTYQWVKDYLYTQVQE